MSFRTVFTRFLSWFLRDWVHDIDIGRYEVVYGQFIYPLLTKCLVLLSAAFYFQIVLFFKLQILLYQLEKFLLWEKSVLVYFFEWLLGLRFLNLLLELNEVFFGLLMFEKSLDFVNGGVFCGLFVFF